MSISRRPRALRPRRAPQVTALATQGEWLQRLGIAARAAALAKPIRSAREDIDAALQRLIAPEQMGELFKVLAIHSPGLAGAGGLRMTITYRDAAPADAEALAESS